MVQKICNHCGLPKDEEEFNWRYRAVVHPLNWTQGQNEINCVREGVQDGTDKKEL